MMKVIRSALAVLLLATVACSPGSTAPTATPEVEGPPPAQEPTATEGSPTAAPTGAGPSLRAEGSVEFVAQAQAAFDLLAQCAPDALATVDRYMDLVQESDRSGMLVEQRIFLASEVTAFAPGYQPASQVFWFAGAIVHDSRHVYQAEQGMTTNWDAMSLDERKAIEEDARGVQIEAMRACLPFVEPEPVRTQATGLVNYLQGMQDGTIPCDYCEVEWANRDW
jgi:hypothetical protein